MGCTDDITSPGIRPNLSCATDLSQLLFRFVDRKSIGIVKGKNELAVMDMSLFFLPLNGYMMTTFKVEAGDTMRIEAGSNMNYGKRREIAEFDFVDFPSATLRVGATVDLAVYENATLLSTIPGIAADDFTTFITNLKDGINADSIINPILEYNTDDTTSVFTLRGKTAGKAYTYELTLTDSVVPAETITGDITQTALRYPGGAWKLMYLSMIFCSQNTASNQQFIEWAYDSDVVANGLSGASWRKSGPLFLQMGAEDVTETDMNLLETIWVRNTTEYDTKIEAILAI